MSERRVKNRNEFESSMGDPSITPMGMPTMPPTDMEGKPPTIKPKIIQPTPEQQKYLGMVQALTERSINLVMKVASCRCDDKENCGVYKMAQDVAEITDQLTEISRKLRDKGVTSGKERR